MAETFSASEIIEFAITIERNGEEFYREAAGNFESQKVKDLFTFLAGEEIKHRQIFEQFLKEVEGYTPAESYTGEYLDYLKVYSRDFIFTQKKRGALALKKTLEEAVDFALQAEIDSILYYIEAKNFVPSLAQTSLDKIIDEERRHYVRLAALRKEL